MGRRRPPPPFVSVVAGTIFYFLFSVSSFLPPLPPRPRGAGPGLPLFLPRAPSRASGHAAPLTAAPAPRARPAPPLAAAAVSLRRPRPAAGPPLEPRSPGAPRPGSRRRTCPRAHAAGSRRLARAGSSALPGAGAQALHRPGNRSLARLAALRGGHRLPPRTEPLPAEPEPPRWGAMRPGGGKLARQLAAGRAWDRAAAAPHAPYSAPRLSNPYSVVLKAQVTAGGHRWA